MSTLSALVAPSSLVTLTGTQTLTNKTLANPAYTGTLTGGTGIVNLGSGQFYKDASGNVGIGVTPSVWSQSKAIQFNIIGALRADLNTVGLNNNAYYNGSWKYLTTNFATTYESYTGNHFWNTAASGTADATISFTQVMRINPSGNLCIGSGDATSKLSFGANIGLDFAVYEGAGGANKYGIGMGGAGTTPNPYRTKIYANGFEYISINTLGNVGIGTVAPATKFHIEQGTTTNGLSLSTSSNAYIGRVYFKHGTNDFVIDASGDTDLRQAEGTNNGSGALSFYTGKGSAIGGTGTSTEKMRIDSSGNVGINTTSPVYKLHIVDQDNAGFGLYGHNVGDGAVLRLFTTSGTIATPTAVEIDKTLGGIRAFGYNGTSYSSLAAGIDFRAAQAFTATAAGSYIAFKTTALNTITPLERVRINQDGNVGINTTNPLSKLHINSATESVIRITSDLSGTTSTDGLVFGINLNGTDSTIWNYENGYLRLATNNVERLRIDASGNITAQTAGTTITSGGAIVIGSNGTYVAGSLYSDANWGMIFRAKQASPAISEFRWCTSSDSQLMTLNSTGNLVLTGTISSSDIAIARTGATTTGYVYYGNTSTKYAGFDGTNFVSSMPMSFNILGNAATATSTPLISPDASLTYGRSGLQYFNLSAAAGDVASTTNTPTADWWHIIRGNHNNNTGYYTDLALPMTAATNIRYRRISAGASSGWITVWDSTNLTNLNQLTNGPGYTANTGTVTSVSGTGTVSGLTLSGTVTSTGNLTLGGTLSLTSGNVTTALGYTPYNSSNPSGYITSSGTAANATTAVTANTTNAKFIGNFVVPINDGNWYRVATYDGGNQPRDAIFKLTTGNHLNIEFKLSIGAGGDTGELEVNVLGYFPNYYATYPYNIRLVSGGTNSPSHVDIQLSGLGGNYFYVYEHRNFVMSGNSLTYPMATLGNATAAGTSQAFFNSSLTPTRRRSIIGNSYYRTPALTTDANGALTDNITFAGVRKGLIGVYDPQQTQAIFAMGAAYVLTDGGNSSTYGSFYGLAWSYNPNYTVAGNNPQSKAGLNHQLLVMNGGGTVAALGVGVWTSGNVTAYSDERLKKDWAPLAINFTESLSKVKVGSYSRTDIDQRQVGVSAQSLQALMPEAVTTDGLGMLSVAYGNAALAACVELAKEIVELKKRIAILEAK